MILDGKNIKNIILNEVKHEIDGLNTKLKLVVIQVGDNDASNVYIKQKSNMCKYVGYDFEHIKLINVDTDSILKVIDKLNKDESVTGIMVQLPLPREIDADKILNSISSLKDVDGLTVLNNGNLFQNRDGLYSCTASGIMELLHRYNIDISGKNVVIVGRSNLVGKPLSLMMLNKDAMVTMCHSKTSNLSDYTKRADILVIAVGVPNLITNDMIKENVVVIDVGITLTNDGICGDVDFESVKDKCSYITPVPGGVGPMTVSMIAKNILKAYRLQNEEIN